MNGTTVEDLQNAIRISPAAGFNRYWIDPKFVGPDGRANPDFIQVPSTPGELGQYVILRGKNTWTLDAALNKDFSLPGRANLRLHMTMTNVLNHPIWNAPGWSGGYISITSTTFGQIGSPFNGARQMYLRTEITF